MTAAKRAHPETWRTALNKTDDEWFSRHTRCYDPEVDSILSKVVPDLEALVLPDFVARPQKMRRLRVHVPDDWTDMSDCFEHCSFFKELDRRVFQSFAEE